MAELSSSSNSVPTYLNAPIRLEDVLVTSELDSRPQRSADVVAESKALRQLSQAMAASPDELIQTLIELGVQLCRADTCGLSLLETTPEGDRIFRWTNLAGTLSAHVGGFTPRDFSPCGVCLDRHAPQLLEYPSRLFQYLNGVDVPIVEALIIPLVPIGDDPLGTIWILSHHEERRFDSEDVRMMTSLAEFTSTALRLLRSKEVERAARMEAEAQVAQRTSALRRLSISLLQSQDEERRRIARELHDSVGQYLTGLKLNLSRLNGAEHQPLTPELLAECLHAVDECLTETRTISYLLHPPLLDEAGFASAARWYVNGFTERTGIRARLDLPPELSRLPRGIELTLFRILQESLTNVNRHSGSQAVEIHLNVDAEGVTLQVSDFGHGIPAEKLERFRQMGTTGGVGWGGMMERIADLGGELKVQSNGHGTVLTATIPLPLTGSLNSAA